MKQNFGKVGVLMGGVSSEREISLKSGEAVVCALQQENCNVAPIDIQIQNEDDIEKQIKDTQIDVAFIVLHGKFGEDGRIQQILERLEIPYTGSGVEASHLALHKMQSQKIFKNNGIRIPNYVSLSSTNNDIIGVSAELNGFPLVVKPSSEGSSIGISIAFNEEELKSAVKRAFELDTEVLIEKFIPGRELTVGILDQKTLPIIEICPTEPFFNFEAKYKKGKTEYIVPAVLTEEIAKEISDTAFKAHTLLGCCDLSRVDFILDRENDYYLLEVNTIPGFTATSLLPKAAGHIGINFNQLCLQLVEIAYGKKKEKRKIQIIH